MLALVGTRTKLSAAIRRWQSGTHGALLVLAARMTPELSKTVGGGGYDGAVARNLLRSLFNGARQVGKSTLARSLGPDIVINPADEASYSSYAKDPARLRHEIEAVAKRSLIMIDEVQRIRPFSNTVQALMDECTRHRFILTGSSVRKLKRGQANLLPGRVVLEYLVTRVFSMWLPQAAVTGSTTGSSPVTLRRFFQILEDTQRSLIAIECKLGRHVSPRELSGLHSFAWIAKKPLQSVVVFQGERSMRFDGNMTALPYREFLSELLPSVAAG